MARRRRRKSRTHEDTPVHETILEHLDEHPPPRSKEAEEADRSSRTHRSHPRRHAAADPPPPPRRPHLMLRKMPLEQALETLGRFLQARRRLGDEELIVVVGKGHHSPGGRPILAPAVRDWLDAHPELVAGYEEAPAHEGGAGALLVRLQPL